MTIAIKRAGILWVLAATLCHALEKSPLQAGADESARGDIVHAAADLQAAIALEPQNPEAWYQLGLLYAKTTAFRNAELALRKAVEYRSHFPQAHFWLGWTLIIDPQSKLDWPGAIAEARLALADKADYADALNLLGAGLTNLGQWDEAVEVLKRAALIQPPSAAAHFNLAAAFEKSGRKPEAQKEYAAALAIQPNYPEAHSALGNLLLSLGKPAEAEQSLLEALRQNPDLPTAHYMLARALQAQKKTEAAQVEFREASALTHVQANGVQATNMSNDSLGLASRGDFAGATQTLRRAVALKPDYGVPHYNLGLILADSGDMSGAVRELSVAITLMPGQAKPWFDLGRVFERQGDVERAREAYSWAARLAPSDPAMQAKSKLLPATPQLNLPNDTAAQHLSYGETLLGEGEALDAIGELLRSLALDPTNRQGRHDLARAYASIDALDNAALEYHKLLLLAPHDAGAHIALGKILLQQDQAEQAAAEFRTALSYEPDSSEAKTLLARIPTRPLRP